jgi:hypothetical protein
MTRPTNAMLPSNAMLPTNAIRLINEYSKPRTSPYWRLGIKHARLIQDSNLMTSLTYELLCIIRDQPERAENNFGKDLLDISIQTPFNEIIQKYGEDIFQLFTIAYYSQRKHNMLSNFYSFIKVDLNYTGNIITRQYMSYETHWLYTYVWDYKKHYTK